ncbi:phage holin family protein [Demequina sediminicola]|uniref:phage holin family protein n=1 Tax=Demequina sediminicola TaxID=1095026 RepID=UPI0007848959|nr:phage holin family protein [Demequina sediminicola]
MKFVLRAVAMGLAVWVTTLLPLDVAVVGGESEWWTRALVFLAVGALLQLMNQVIKPVISVLALPITILTLGLFTLVINWFILWLAAWLTTFVPDITLELGGFWVTLGAALVIAITSGIVNGLTGSKS